MKFRYHGMRGGAPRTLRLGSRGLSGGGIAIAVVSAGVAMGLAGCGPVSSAGTTGQPSGGASSGGQTNSATASAGTTQKASTPAMARAGYRFTTLDNPADVTFNQLLGFNNGGVIAGYFGSGAAGHPNKGYVLVRTRAGFKITNENFPGSRQTQVTGLNDRGVTVGFWSDMNNANEMNDNFGFYRLNGRFHTVNFPTGNNATPPVNQLLGVNNHDVAVGFYNDAKGNSHGYTFSIFGHRFRSVTVRGAASLTATAINNRGDVAGFFTNAAGATQSFLRAGSRVFKLAVPGASMTQALGVDDFHAVVGVYTVGSGDAAVTHGFIWTPLRGFQTVDDPQGIGTTTINGVNDQGDIVGFYADGAGNTHGFAAVQQGHNPLPGLIAAANPSPSTSMSSSPAPSTPPSSTMPTASTTPPTSPTGTTAPPTAPPSTITGTHM
jgi:hypothetical protein